MGHFLTYTIEYTETDEVPFLGSSPLERAGVTIEYEVPFLGSSPLYSGESPCNHSMGAYQRI